MYGTIPLSQGKIADVCRLRSTKLIFVGRLAKFIFVGYGQINSTTVLDFCTRHICH